MGDFSINGTQNLDIILQADINRFKLKYPLADSNVSVINSEYGRFFFQEIKLSRCSIWVSEYQMLQTAQLYGAVNEPILELHCMLEGGMLYQMDGFGEIRMPSNSFNLFQQPYAENRVVLPKGAHVITFDIHFEPEYIEELCQHYAQLNPLMEQVIKKNFYLLQKMPVPLNRELAGIIQSVLHAPSRPHLQKMLLEKAIEAYVMDSVYYLTDEHKKPVKATEFERGRMRAVRNHLESNLDDQSTILELAKRFAINSSQLKKLFKEETGQTILEFRTDKRMAYGSLLLREGESVESTAFRVGYSSTSAFIHRFKEYHLLSPLQYLNSR